MTLHGLWARTPCCLADSIPTKGRGKNNDGKHRASIFADNNAMRHRLCMGFFKSPNATSLLVLGQL
jgi:hypothetical protein